MIKIKKIYKKQKFTKSKGVLLSGYYTHKEPEINKYEEYNSKTNNVSCNSKNYIVVDKCILSKKR